MVKRLKTLGIQAFGKTVKEAKVYMLEFLDRHPELRDEDPEQCLMKIIYYFAYCGHNDLPI